MVDSLPLEQPTLLVVGLLGAVSSHFAVASLENCHSRVEMLSFALHPYHRIAVATAPCWHERTSDAAAGNGTRHINNPQPKASV